MNNYIKIDSHGNKVWYKNGKYHREDGPAIEGVSGNKVWYKDGICHREDGPAIEFANVEKTWYKNGLLHREGGPAKEFISGDKEWWQNGKLHREDGPAIEYNNGAKYWALFGKKMTKEEFDKINKNTTKVKIDEYGTKRYYVNNVLHREDGPAVEFSDGTKHWYKNGKLHREDGPAVEDSDGDKHWYKNGKHHRDDGPAVELSDGTKEWYINGLLHQENGPAIECSNGSKYWYKNGSCHREDGPAVELSNGTKVWYKNGKRHREDGPAVEYADKTVEYFLEDVKYIDVEQWKQALNNANKKSTKQSQGQNSTEYQSAKINQFKKTKNQIINRSVVQLSASTAQKAILELLSLLGIRKNSKVFKFFASDLANNIVKTSVGLFLLYCPFTQDEKYKKIADELLIQAGVSTVRQAIEVILSVLTPHAKKFIQLINNIKSAPELRVAETSGKFVNKKQIIEEGDIEDDAEVEGKLVLNY